MPHCHTPPRSVFHLFELVEHQAWEMALHLLSKFDVPLEQPDEMLRVTLCLAMAHDHPVATTLAHTLLSEAPWLARLSNDEHGGTVLMCATGNPEIFARLLTLVGDDPMYGVVGETEASTTVFHEAARQGHLATLEMLLQRDESPAVTDAAGNTPLMVAARAGQRAVVRRLLHDPRLHRSIDAVNHDGFSALLCAAKALQGTVVQDLLAMGAQPWVVHTHERSSEPYPGEEDLGPRVSTQGLLHALGDRLYDPRDDATEVQRLAQRWAMLVDPLARNDRGYTALTMAVRSHNPITVKALLQIRGDWSAHVDHDGRDLVEHAWLSFDEGQAMLNPRFDQHFLEIAVLDIILMSAPIIDQVSQRVAERGWSETTMVKSLPRWFQRHESWRLRQLVSRAPPWLDGSNPSVEHASTLTSRPRL